jgi:hypothetical protein
VAWGGISDREEWGLVVEKHRRRRSRSSGTDRVTVGHHELCGGHGSVSVTELRRTAAKHSHRFARVGPVPSDAQQLQADPAEATGPRAVVLDPPTRGGAERRAIRGHRAWVRPRGGGLQWKRRPPAVGRPRLSDDQARRMIAVDVCGAMSRRRQPRIRCSMGISLPGVVWPSLCVEAVG